MHILILTSQTSTRRPIIGHGARNLEAQQVFLNTFENIINRRVNVSEDIRRFQKTLQYTRSKVDYAIGEFIYMLPSDMNLRIGKVKNYNNKILISSRSFKIATNLKINLDGEKDKPDVKTNEEQKSVIKLNKEHKQDVKPNIKFDRESKYNTNKITYEEEQGSFGIGNNIYLYGMVDVQVTTFSLSLSCNMCIPRLQHLL